MVQILPQKTNVGTQIGQALGMGLEKGLNQGIQRGLTNQGFDQLLQQVGDDSQLRNTLEILRQGALNPALDRSTAAVAPLVLNRARTEGLYGGKGQVDETGRPLVKNPAEAGNLASKFVHGDKPAGYLSAPMSPEQMQQYAGEYARALGTPEAFDRGLAQAQNINNNRIQSRETLESNALKQGIRPDELPRFMQFATEFQDLNDIPAITRAATDKMLKLRNDKEALRNANIPGIYQNLGGAKQHFIPGMTLFKAFTSKGEARQKALKGYSEKVKNLVDQGEEVYARQTLGDLGLSQTEVEELIHPLTPAIENSIGKLPKGNQMNRKARKESLMNFFKNNLSNDTSLLVLRDNLINQKGYDWNEVLDAVNSAFPRAESLNEYQRAELSALAQPPIQSLSQLFGPTPNLRGFLRGQK